MKIIALVVFCFCLVGQANAGLDNLQTESWQEVRRVECGGVTFVKEKALGSPLRIHSRLVGYAGSTQVLYANFSAWGVPESLGYLFEGEWFRFEDVFEYDIEIGMKYVLLEYAFSSDDRSARCRPVPAG